MMNPVPWLQMTNMISYQGLVRTFPSRKPLLKTVMQNWMQRSQQTLEQWFEPGTARALDAFIEGMTLHFVTDRKPLSREEILRMVERVAG